MRTVKFTIAYDGTAYAGWQVQPGKPTVQETLQKAVARVTGAEASVLASGRTDAGVHASGQVVAFRTDCRLPPEVLLRAVNANLPEDIAVLDAADAPAGFHPIRDVVRKRYRYTICDCPLRDVFRRHFVWHYAYGRLDAEAMRRAAAALLGTHDFSSFESAGAKRKTSVRTIYDLSVERGRAGQGGKEGLAISDRGLGIRDECDAPGLRLRGACGADYGDFVTIEIEANGFLYNMVRAIVGTLVEVGRGGRPESWPGEALQAKDRRCAGATVPPQGLCLVKVEYGPSA
jgi:tRNA pseudouridine38-40 synthase